MPFGDWPGLLVPSAKTAVTIQKVAAIRPAQTGRSVRPDIRCPVGNRMHALWEIYPDLYSNDQFFMQTERDNFHLQNLACFGGL